MKKKTVTVLDSIVLEVKDFTKEQMDSFIASFENIKNKEDSEDSDEFAWWALFENDEFYDEHGYEIIDEIILSDSFLEKQSLNNGEIYRIRNDFEVRIDYSNILKELEKHF